MKLCEAAAGAAQSRDGTGSDAVPAVLLVEDDPTTLAYLQAITEALPARVETATCLADALRLAQSRTYALWLVDANLPDGTGIDLLRHLRAQCAATPALAHTAARGQCELDALLAAGFGEVLVKPVAAGQWHAAIRRHLHGHARTTHAPVAAAPLDTLLLWDDDAAAAALGGHRANVDALRGLFLAELPAQLDALRSGGADQREGQLHRLRASCAFVGAARLDAAVRDLQDAPECDARLQQVIDIGNASITHKPQP